MIARRQKRNSSNVFHMFHKDQMSEMRDAFSLFDTDGDGKVTFDDLNTFLESIGSPYSKDEIKEMIDQLEPNGNFMMFLTYIGDYLSSMNDITDIVRNFKNLDEANKGTLCIEFLKDISGLNDKDFNKLIQGCVKNNEVDYSRLAIKMKYGEIIETEIKQDEN